MSHWVHVAAVVRFDALRPLCDDASFIDEIKEHFGKSTEDYSCNWDDEKSVDEYIKATNDAFEHPENWLPGGSEGTCEMKIYEDPDPCSMAAYTVTIFGDLRDVDTGGHIVKWFKKKLSAKALEDRHFWVRQAVITVNEEYTGKDLCWVWKENPE